VPFIIRGPGIKPGSCSHARAVGADLLPTIAELAHVTEPLFKGVEGGSFVSVLTNAGEGVIKRPREEFVVHFPHYDKDAIGPASAILLGDYKLIRVYETGALKLFNIANDPSERHDLAHEMPEKVTALNQRLTDYLLAVNAQMPRPNPNYDANKPTETNRDGKRKAQR
jgi:arylsulfatase A